jgi:hypothetical protein
MAKMKREELQRIVKRDMPGYRLARKKKAAAAADSARSVQGAEARSPSLDALRRKYSGKASIVTPRPDVRARVRTRDTDDDEIVAIEPEEVADPWDGGSRPKAVVISGRNKRIVGKQG